MSEFCLFSFAYKCNMGDLGKTQVKELDVSFPGSKKNQPHLKTQADTISM